jgi:hypothetical protein
MFKCLQNSTKSNKHNESCKESYNNQQASAKLISQLGETAEAFTSKGVLQS